MRPCKCQEHVDDDRMAVCLWHCCCVVGRRWMVLARIKPSPPFVPQNLPPTGHSPVISANLTHASSNQYLSEAHCHVAKWHPWWEKLVKEVRSLDKKGGGVVVGVTKNLKIFLSDYYLYFLEWFAGRVLLTHGYLINIKRWEELTDR
jgi:hypothetical protein